MSWEVDMLTDERRLRKEEGRRRSVDMIVEIANEHKLVGSSGS